MTLVVVLERNTHAMTLVDPCGLGKEDTCNESGGLGKEHTCSDSRGGLGKEHTCNDSGGHLGKEHTCNDSGGTMWFREGTHAMTLVEV